MFFFSFIHLGNFHIDPQETFLGNAVKRQAAGGEPGSAENDEGKLEACYSPILCLGPFSFW